MMITIILSLFLLFLKQVQVHLLLMVGMVVVVVLMLEDIVTNLIMLSKIIEEQKRHLIENGEEYNKLQLDGLCDWLNQSHEQKTKFFISSWDTEVYSILAEKFKSQKVLLDMFPKDYKPNTAIPHPSADAHRFWFDKIKNKI